MLVVLVAGILSLVAIVFVKITASKEIIQRDTGYECGFCANHCDIAPHEYIPCLVILELIALFFLIVVIGII